MGIWSDWYSKNAGKENSLVNVEFVLKQLDLIPLKEHTHDDRYYTESEVNTKSSGKSNTDHTHPMPSPFTRTNYNITYIQTVNLGSNRGTFSLMLLLA
jgi:hypothetical protein